MAERLFQRWHSRLPQPSQCPAHNAPDVWIFMTSASTSRSTSRSVKPNRASFSSADKSIAMVIAKSFAAPPLLRG